MARDPREYASSLQLNIPGSEVTVVPSVPLSTTSNIRKLSFTNTNSTTNRLVIVYKVPSAGSVGAGTEFARKSISPLKFWNVSIAQGETLVQGGTIQASQDVGTDVNANCAGADVT